MMKKILPQNSKTKTTPMSCLIGQPITFSNNTTYNCSESDKNKFKKKSCFNCLLFIINSALKN